MSANKTKTKREAYVSLDRDEMNALRQLGWRHRWMYLELKWLASFRTAEVGRFGRQKITFEQLSKLVSVPTAAGREADTIDGKEAARILMKLHEVGLVGEIDRRNNGGLCFVLPMSPIDKEAARKARQAKASKDRLPKQDAAQLHAKAHTDSACEVSSTSQSVMTPYGCLNTLFSNDGAGGTPAPRRVGSAPTPGSSENPTPGAISLARLKGLLHEAWFAYVDTPDSERFYANWLNQGFSHTEFEEAVEQVKLDDSPTPAALDRVLRKRRVQQARPKPGRGRVAL